MRSPRDSRQLHALQALTVVCFTLLHTACAKSCAPNCTLSGTCDEEVGRCDCPRHLTGDACSPFPDAKSLEASCKQYGWVPVKACIHPHPFGVDAPCVNGCHGNGTCVGGFCHCHPGHYGMDCAVRTGTDGKPAILPDRGYKPRARGPRIYVYNLPPRLTVWRGETFFVERHTLRHFLERLVPTGVRVADGASADWFFLPITLRDQLVRHVLVDAITYVRQAYPWWNATGGGHRHFVVATGDMGRVESEYAHTHKLGYGKLSENLTFVSYWGLHQERAAIKWAASHRPATDIVLPVLLGTPKMAAMGLLEGRHHPKFMELAVPSLRERNGPLFYFSGRVCGDGSPPRLNASFPHCSSVRSHVYSGGVRQMVHYHHWNRTGFFIQLRDPKYAEHLRTSRFCFGPMGGGHGQRQIQAVLAGCVPVLISDGVYEAFEPVLDWGRFGVRVAEADIPRLHEILEAISPEEYALKASRLRCAAQHMAFSLTTGALFGESGAFDAFETLLEVLRAKAAHPDVPFERLRQEDPQLDAFLDCRDLDQLDSAAAPEGPGPGAAGAAAGQGSTNGTADVRQGSAGAVQAESGAGSASQGPSRGANAAKGRGRVCSVSPFDEEDPGVEQCRTVVIPTGGFMCAHSPRDLTACLRPWA